MSLPEEEDNTSWTLDLENALLEECSATDIYCICKGKPLPDNLRAEVWQICLDVRDKGNQLDQFNEIFDLPNQTLLRDDCVHLISKLDNDEEEKLSILADLESILTYYCKSRNLDYEKDNGWIELLLPLVTLKEPKAVVYNLFEAIRDTYIPHDLHKNDNAFHILRLLLLYHDPELCSFLDTKKLTPNLYCGNWFQSLFAGECNLTATLTMWDYYFQQSDPFFIFFLSLIMVVNAREQIIGMKDNSKEDLINMIRQMPAALDAEDISDFCSLAQYYTVKTPASFRSELLLHILYSSKGEDKIVSQALCLPISVQELVDNSTMVEAASVDSVRFFLVDCRPIEQYNAGHLPTAFHLDCNLMLQEPSAFQTAVQGLLNAQRQAVAVNSTSGGEHLCFLGSGRNEEDQYTHMVVASFLQKHTQYVSLLTGGYIGLHSYFGAQAGNYLQDHEPKYCIVCAPLLGTPQTSKSSILKQSKTIATNSYSSSTSSSSSTAIFGKISAAMRTKSAEMKDILYEYIAQQPSATNMGNNLSVTGNNMGNSGSPKLSNRHVSSADRQGKRYRNVAPVFSIDDDHENIATNHIYPEEDSNEIVLIQTWLKDPDIVEHFPCQEVKLNGFMYKSHLMVTDTHLIVLRELVEKKGYAEVVTKRPLSAIVKITAKRRHPELITFKYGLPDGESLLITDMDRFLIPNAAKATKTVSDQILKQLKSKD